MAVHGAVEYFAPPGPLECLIGLSAMKYIPTNLFVCNISFKLCVLTT